MFEYLNSLDIELMLTYALLTVVGVQLFYYLFFYIRVVFKPKTVSSKKLPAVSVVICAKDEEDNLRTFLPKVLKQDYPDFEVVVVNDCSHDESEVLLAKMKQKYTHLRTTTIEEARGFKHGKKLALTLGIKAAKNEYLVLTDADCIPVSDQWIRLMAGRFSDNKKIVLGYGGYEERKGFLNKLIRFDTMFIALTYMTFAKAGVPYMGVGRNLAYLKDLFAKNKGFSSHYKLQSGDDDLFVNEVASRKNVDVVLDPNSFTTSIPNETFIHWRYQKMRHLTTNHRYKFLHRFLLGLEPLSRILFYIFAPVYFIAQIDVFFYYVLGAVCGRMLIYVIVLTFAQHRFRERGLLVFSLIFDVIMPLIYLYISLSKFVSTQRRK